MTSGRMGRAPYRPVRTRPTGTPPPGRTGRPASSGGYCRRLVE